MDSKTGFDHESQTQSRGAQVRDTRPDQGNVASRECRRGLVQHNEWSPDSFKSVLYNANM